LHATPVKSADAQSTTSVSVDFILPSPYKVSSVGLSYTVVLRRF